VSATTVEAGAHSTRSDEHRAAVSHFAVAFKSAMGAVRRLRGRESQHADGLSYAQFGLLFSLEEPGECSASELAASAGVAPATATQMLDHLAAQGFVERVRSERDRRIVLVSLTARGRDLVAARRAHYEAHWTKELAGFTVEQLETATAVLARAAGVFTAIAAESDAEQRVINGAGAASASSA
jgi:DNA-binding MarR family transcriptional regulator